MVLSWIRQLFNKKSRPFSRSGRCQPNPSRFVPAFEPLDERILPAVTASFSAGTGIMSVPGEARDNTIVVSRDVSGQILVNGGAIAIQGGLFCSDRGQHLTLIQIFRPGTA